MRTTFGRGTTILIELGPGGLLTAASSLCSDDGTAPAFVPSLAGRTDPQMQLAQALGRVWAEGGEVDWSAVTRRPPAPPRLPLYPFERRTHWLAAAGPRPPAQAIPNGSMVSVPLSEVGAGGSMAGALPASAPAPDVLALDVSAPDASAGRVSAGELTWWLRVSIAAVLGLAGPEDVDPDAGLFDLGVTSAMTVELRAGLERIVGRSLPTTLVFDYPTIRKLAAHLTGQQDHRAAAPRRSPRGGHGTPGASGPLAITGIGCRLPGGVTGPRSYWSLLAAGRDATCRVPADRWDADGFYDADPAAAGKAHTCRGGFLDGPIDGFDAEAFGISPREARSMDPQQRLLLEVTWEALGDAGYTAETMAGSNTAVYVGMNTSDYMNLLSADPAAGEDPYLATGNAFSVAAGRLSYLLGSHGQSMAVDTACSSSLVAVHLAARALRSGEVDMALVAGVNLMLSPATTVSLAKLRALSPDGRCKAFSAAADGYGRGEGCGVIVVKRLTDAVASGDKIWALIRGSAVNQDGHSAGLTVPNGQAQRAVIDAALRDAGIGPGQVSYVEAHGTGTPLGDPLEISSLADVFRPGWESGQGGGQRLWVGSVKTNIGHLEAAAGIAGLIKVALALRHRRIPAHLHFDEPSPHVDWERVPIRIPRQITAWEDERGPRVAGISSFGFSGTNAHVLLEEAPVAEPAGPPAQLNGSSAPPAGPRLLVLSAHSPQALLAIAASYRDLLALAPATPAPADPVLSADPAIPGPADDTTWPTASWADIARTAALHRSHLPHRLTVVAATAEQAAASLGAVCDGKSARNVRLGEISRDQRMRLIAVYGGQGSQWPGMGRELAAHPVTAEVIDRCDAVVRELAGWSLREALTAPAESSPLSDTTVAQPAIFAVQAALTDLWRHRGAEPDAVIGHSAGEVAAAYAAGVYDLEAACELAVRRGQAMGSTRGAGAMAAAGLDPEQAMALIAASGGEVTIAAVNSPASTVLAGDPGALARLRDEVKARGAFWATVQEEYAFHSPRMAPACESLAAALAGLTPRRPRTLLFSTVTGEAADGLPMDADYWVRNMIQPVLFRDALRAAAGDGHNVVLEIGPHTVLATPATQTLSGAGSGLTVIGSMRARHDARETMLDAAGALHVAGYRLDHQALHSGTSRPGTGCRAELPGYPWQRQRHWIPARPTAPGGAGSGSAGSGWGTAQAEIPEGLRDCMYEVGWHASPLSAGVARDGGRGDTAAAREAGPWLVLADRAGVADRLAERLRSAGEPCEVLPPGPAGSDAVASRISAADSAPRGLIHLGALDALGVGPQPRPGEAPWDEYLASSCAPLLTVPDALDARRRGGGAGPKLWMATRGAVAIGDAPCIPAQAPAWGLGRVVAMERPEIWGGQIDLDPGTGDPGEAAEAIAAEILAGRHEVPGEELIAHRRGERMVARLQRIERLPSAARPFRVHGDAAYLITGGRGSLGLRVAQWLFERGARHLILLGRTPLPARADRAAADPRSREVLDAILRLEECDATIYTPSADVADAEAMAGLFDPAHAPWPAVRGVIHAAGLFGLAELKDIGWADFRAMLRPKVEGTMVLDSLFPADAALDFFILFGSSWSVLGTAFAGHFVAASHFQDVFAHDRAGRGLPALAIDWGWWQDGSLAAVNGAYFESTGCAAIGDGLGFTALGCLAASGAAQAAVAPVHWDRLRPVMEAKRPRSLLAAMGPADPGDDSRDRELLDGLAAATSAARTRLMEAAVQAALASVLGRPAGSRLSRELGFFDAGMDSITAVDLRNQLQARLGAQLPPTMAFEHPSVADLTGFLLGELFAAEVADSPGAGERQPEDELDADALLGDLAAQLDPMSEDELIALLLEELDKGEPV